MERQREPLRKARVVGSTLLGISAVVAMTAAGIEHGPVSGLDALIGGTAALSALELNPNADKIDRSIGVASLFTAAVCMGWGIGGQLVSDTSSTEADMALAAVSLYLGPAIALGRRGYKEFRRQR